MAHSQPAWLCDYKYALKMVPIALNRILQACLTVQTQIGSHDTLMYTSKYAFKYTSSLTWLYAPG